ncbi:MAG: peptidyl-prolyl cis-trans isomerase [Verrucomicrobiota bacterium]|jgi:hypothetical protein
MKLSCTVVAAVALVGAALEMRAALVNGIERVVHDAVITRQDVEEETLSAERELWRDYGGQQEVYERRLAEAEHNNLEHLTERQLILHEFKTAGHSLPDKLIDDFLQAEIRSHGDRMTFIKTLEAEGTTLERHRQRIREQYIERAMREKNVSSEIIISPHKVEVYYQEHHESYNLPDRVKLRLIVLKKSSEPDAPQAREMAEEILAKLKEGASFAEMASMYSEESPEIKLRQEGGDKGWWGKGELRKELDEIAFSLKPGERSGVIETAETCYLMLVGGSDPAHYMPLSEVRDQIEHDLQDQERARLQKQWIEKLRKKTFVSYYY